MKELKEHNNKMTIYRKIETILTILVYISIGIYIITLI